MNVKKSVSGGHVVSVLITGLAIGVAASCPVVAGPYSDSFQPDVFRTGQSLQDRMDGLKDPLGRDCVLRAEPLQLPAAVDLALCRNPATRSAWAAARQQAAALGVAQSAWLPTVSASGGETRIEGDHVDVTGNAVVSAQNTSDAAINLSWTVYDFGARGGRITSARRLLDAAAATANSVAQQTVMEVIQGFYGLVSADANVVAASMTEAAAARSLEVARALQKGGPGSLADVLQAETAYDQALLARVQAETNEKIARGTLAVALGVAADQPLKLQAEPVPDQIPALTARMADLMAEAARQRPDLAAALAQRDAAEANVTVARAVGRPSITVSAGREHIATSDIPHQDYKQISLNVSVPIFSGFSVGYSVRQAQAALEASEVNADKVRLNVSQSVWNAYYALDSANQQLTVTSGLTKTAVENEQAALGRYQAGVGTIVDVLTAQTAAATARQTRINAELAWEVGRAQLAFAIGRLTSAEPLGAGAGPAGTAN